MKAKQIVALVGVVVVLASLLVVPAGATAYTSSPVSSSSIGAFGDSVEGRYDRALAVTDTTTNYWGFWVNVAPVTPVNIWPFVVGRSTYYVLDVDSDMVTSDTSARFQMGQASLEGTGFQGQTLAYSNLTYDTASDLYYFQDGTVSENRQILVPSYNSLSEALSYISQFTTNHNDFPDQPKAGIDSNTITTWDAVFQLGVKSNNQYIYYMNRNDDAMMYLFFVTGGGYVFCSEQDLTPGSAYVYNSNMGFTPVTSDSNSSISYSAQYDLSYTNFLFPVNTNLYPEAFDTYYIPVYSTLTEGLEAVRAQIGPSNLKTVTFTVEPGNAYYVDLTSIARVDSLSMTTDVSWGGSSMYSYNSTSDLTYSTQCYGYSTSDSLENITFPTSWMTKIPWQPAGKPDLFGNYSSAQYNSTNEQTSLYLVIYNPYYSAYHPDTGAYDTRPLTNFPIHVTLTGTVRGGVNVPLEQYYVSSGYGSNTDHGTMIPSTTNGYAFDVTFDSNGNPVYTDPDGNLVTPSAGGLNQQEEPKSVGNSIKDILVGFTDRFFGLFSTGYDAISNLVNLGSDFVGVLSSLYSWLPTPVLTALTSAIMLCITIGVLKVFL